MSHAGGPGPGPGPGRGGGGADGPEPGGRPGPDLAGAGTILFDLDGTLVASAPGILASVRHALAALGEPTPPAAVLHEFLGPPLLDSFRDLCGLDPASARAAVTAYRAYYATTGQFECAVYDGIPELLTGVRASGRELAVATSKAEVFARSVLDHLGLAGHVLQIVGSELDGRRTGKAEVIAETLARLDRAAADAVMVGDRRHDLEGARAVGVRCVGVLWGYGTADELRGADLLVATPAELLEALSRTAPARPGTVTSAARAQPT